MLPLYFVCRVNMYLNWIWQLGMEIQNVYIVHHPWENYIQVYQVFFRQGELALSSIHIKWSADG